MKCATTSVTRTHDIEECTVLVNGASLYVLVTIAYEATVLFEQDTEGGDEPHLQRSVWRATEIQVTDIKYVTVNGQPYDELEGRPTRQLIDMLERTLTPSDFNDIDLDLDPEDDGDEAYDRMKDEL